MGIMELKEKIQELSASQAAHRRSAVGPARQGAWQSQAGTVRASLRALYLAYAILRNVPYARLERITREPLPIYDLFRLTGLDKVRIESWAAPVGTSCDDCISLSVMT